MAMGGAPSGVHAPPAPALRCRAVRASRAGPRRMTPRTACGPRVDGAAHCDSLGMRPVHVAGHPAAPPGRAMNIAIVRRPLDPAAAALAAAGLSPVLARAYAARGIRAIGELDHALRALPPFASMRGIDAAAARLADAIARRERILIVADYDADGATACAVGVRGLARDRRRRRLHRPQPLRVRLRTRRPRSSRSPRSASRTCSSPSTTASPASTAWRRPRTRGHRRARDRSPPAGTRAPDAGDHRESEPAGLRVPEQAHRRAWA